MLAAQTLLENVPDEVQRLINTNWQVKSIILHVLENIDSHLSGKIFEEGEVVTPHIITFDKQKWYKLRVRAS